MDMAAPPIPTRPVPTPVLGVAIFIASEVMFFAALIAAHLVIRAGEFLWPPLGQPRLPVAATALNTLVLLASGAALSVSARAYRSPFRLYASRRWLRLTMALGAVFVLVQGLEWVRLVGFGLTMRSSLYGAIFYVIVGAHAVHAAAGLCVLLWIAVRVRGGYAALPPESFAAARLFWYFVVGVWPVLYVLVYLY